MPPMSEPIILATWTFGKIATAAGWPYLSGPNGSSLDAVEQALPRRRVRSRGDERGPGRLPGSLRRGFVGCLDHAIALPMRLGLLRAALRASRDVARMVMERLHIVLLAGDGADRFALRQGLTPVQFVDRQRAGASGGNGPRRASRPAMPRRCTLLSAEQPRRAFRRELSQFSSGTVRFSSQRKWDCPLPCDDETLPHNRHHDTVGVLAIDSSGTLSGACSTSGLPFKAPGRVGDSPIIGHGLYVDPRRGAAVATGEGRIDHGRLRQLSRRRTDGPRRFARRRRTRSDPTHRRQLRTRRGRPGGDHCRASVGPDGAPPRCGRAIARPCARQPAMKWPSRSASCCRRRLPTPIGAMQDRKWATESPSTSVSALHVTASFAAIPRAASEAS